jgi:hypothetical protein
MIGLTKNFVFSHLTRSLPLIILYISVLNEFDLNYIKYFSFNFPFILIFYWNLRKSEVIGYGHIFIAGIVNDVVVGFPVGISSFNYLLICGFASYLRTITLRPSMIKDWFFFLFTILVVNSLHYSVLVVLFEYNLDYTVLFFNIFFTFLFFLIFSNIFLIYQNIFFRTAND